MRTTNSFFDKLHPLCPMITEAWRSRHTVSAYDFLSELSKILSVYWRERHFYKRRFLRLTPAIRSHALRGMAFRSYNPGLSLLRLSQSSAPRDVIPGAIARLIDMNAMISRVADSVKTNIGKEGKVGTGIHTSARLPLLHYRSDCPVRLVSTLLPPHRRFCGHLDLSPRASPARGSAPSPRTLYWHLGLP